MYYGGTEFARYFIIWLFFEELHVTRERSTSFPGSWEHAVVLKNKEESMKI